MKSLGRKKFVISSLLFWVALALIAVLTERVYILGSTINLGEGVIPMMPNKVFGAFAVLTFIAYFIYIYFEFYIGKTKKNFLLAGLLLLFFLIGTFAIWFNSTYPFSLEGTGFLNEAGLKLKLTYTILLGFSLLAIYAILAIFPKNKVSSKTLNWFYYAVALLGLVSIVVSLIKEFDMYTAVFTGGIELRYITIRSFYLTENTYGVMLLLSFIALGLINYQRPVWWRYIFMIVFALATIFTTSLLCIVLLGVFALTYFISITVKLFKEKNKKAALAHLLVIPILIAICASIFVVLNHFNITPVTNFFDFIAKSIFEKDYHSLSNRIPNWQNALKLIVTPLDWIIGQGFNAFGDNVALYSQIDGSRWSRYIDSGLVSIIGSFGLIGLLAYAGLIIYVIHMFKVAAKNGRLHKVLMPFIAFLIILGHGVFEDTIFFIANTKGLVITIMLVLPIAIEYNAAKNPELVKEYISEENIMHTPQGVAFDHAANVLSALFIALAISLFGVSLIWIGDLGQNRDIFIITLSLGMMFLALFFTYPYLIKIWGHKLKKTGFVSTLTFSLILTIGLSGLLGLIFYIISYNLVIATIFFAVGVISISLFEVVIYILIYCQIEGYLKFLKEQITSTIVNTILTLFVFSIVALFSAYFIPISLFLFSAYLIAFSLIYLTSLILLINNTQKKNKWVESVNYYNDVYLRNVRTNLLIDPSLKVLIDETEDDSVQIEQI